MDSVSWTSILAVIGTATSFLALGWKIAQGFEEKMERALKENREETQKEFAIVWKRFDERKEYVDRIQKEQLKQMNSSFVRKEVYELNHKHLEQGLKAQMESFIKLVDEKFNHVIEEIKSLKKNNE